MARVCARTWRVASGAVSRWCAVRRVVYVKPGLREFSHPATNSNVKQVTSRAAATPAHRIQPCRKRTLHTAPPRPHHHHVTRSCAHPRKIQEAQHTITHTRSSSIHHLTRQLCTRNRSPSLHSPHGASPSPPSSPAPPAAPRELAPLRASPRTTPHETRDGTHARRPRSSSTRPMIKSRRHTRRPRPFLTSTHSLRSPPPARSSSGQAAARAPPPRPPSAHSTSTGGEGAASVQKSGCRHAAPLALGPPRSSMTLPYVRGEAAAREARARPPMPAR